MHEQEFRDAYRATQNDVRADEALKRQAMERIEAFATEDGGSVEATKKRSSARIVRPSWQRWGIGIAACLVCVALAVAAPFALPTQQSAPDESASPAANQPSSIDASETGFTVKAYASSSNSILDLGENGMIAFSREMNGLEESKYETEGFYTGCLFSVEGAGIQRVQASVSSGELYEYTYEEFKVSEAPDRWKEALRWKPLRRGMGIYAAYDDVKPAAVPGYEKDDPEKPVQVRLTKILGSTIDVEASASDFGETYFGLWTNEPYDTSQPDSFGAIIDTYEGKTLTVTVQFDDGTYATQVIELHSAYLRYIQSDKTIGGASGIELLPEVVEPEDGLATNAYRAQNIVKSLYGVVVEADNEPFPGSLEHANERAGEVRPAMTLERCDPIESVENSAALAQEDILPADGAITIQGNSTHEDATLDIRVLGIGEPTKRLPDGITRDMTRMGDDPEYENRISEQVSGYTVSEDGVISGDYSFLPITISVSNESARSEIADTGSFGSLAVLDADGVHARSAGDIFARGKMEDDIEKGTARITFHPNTTRTYDLLLITSDEAFTYPSLLWLVYEDPGKFTAIDLGQVPRK